MTVERVGQVWVCRSTFAERHIPKEAGFRWNPEARYWFTAEGAIAARLMSSPADKAAAMAADSSKYHLRRQNLADSNAHDADIDIPANPGLAYLGYQRAGIAAMLPRPNVLLADDPGLGKTIQAVGLINCLPDIKKILVVCPNSLRFNWRRELQKWLTRRLTIGVFHSQFCRPDMVDIGIIHYDVVAKWSDMLRSVRFDLVICDECHLLKNPKAQRTRAILGIDDRTARREEIEPLPALRGRRAIFMTGTPLPNRPVEGFPIFHYLDPIEFRSFNRFKRDFCGAYFNGFGVDDSGASNLAELQALLRSTIMIRRLKADVLTELPAKRRAIVEIPAPDEARQAISAELNEYRTREAALAGMRQAVAAAKATDDRAGYAAAVQQLKEAQIGAFSGLSKQRHETATKKLPYVLDHLRTLIEGGEKIVCFAHHQDVIRAIAGEFGAVAVTCYGPDTPARRQDHVDRFQREDKCRLIVGEYGPMGTGWTLTASSHVVAAELDWVPGNMTQAEDRCHRIGQHDSVLVEHLVLEGSLDAYMAAVIVQKQEVQAEALDADMLPELPKATRAPAGPAAVTPIRSVEPAPGQGPAADLTDAEQMCLFG